MKFFTSTGFRVKQIYVMNPVVPIAANRCVRAAALHLLFCALYRSATGRMPSPTTATVVGAALALAVTVDIAVTAVGPLRPGYPDLVTRIPTNERVIALTFDDGPTTDHTLRLLDRLDEISAPATFFLLGSLARQNPELVKAIQRRGHKVALHGNTHDALPLRSSDYITEQIRLAQDVIGTGALGYFRPPYGFKSLAMRGICHKEKVSLTTWSINPKDYHEPGADVIVQRVTDSLHKGAIILLHEWSSSTYDALPELVRQIRDRGYKLVLLPER